MIHLHRSPLLALGILLAIAVSSETNLLQGQTLQDNALRANYLLGFVDFVRWETPQDEVSVIAVLGSKALISELNAVAEKKRSQGRKFEIIELCSETSLDKVDLIYVGAGHRQRWLDLLESGKRKSIIMVGEEDGFLNAGGLIEFITKNNRLRFMLNLQKAEEYRVQVSSKLAQMAAH